MMKIGKSSAACAVCVTVKIRGQILRSYKPVSAEPRSFHWLQSCLAAGPECKDCSIQRDIA